MGTVTRDVRFKKGQGPKEQAREIVKSYYPAWVEFIQEDGSTVRNIISEGEEGFCMTYAFEFDLPDLQEGTEELGKEVERLKAVSFFLHF